MRCSAAFAIVAGQQQRGEGTTWPALGWRGREFMVRTGARLIDAGWTEPQVSAAMTEAAGGLQQEAIASGDADRKLAQVMRPCLSLLDTAVPPLQKPNLPQCAAILRASYEEVHAAEGLSARAKDLLTLATVLEARTRREATEQGRTQAEADAVLAAEATTVAKVAALPGGMQRYDIATCFDLAKPEEKTHY
ncbi:hypothetical protein [Croceicoccus naphthovorans]|uniref:hypothetical protein n=1 Tax=Croceicoccus naphthovorans TaxID=1348774 RepID=UPI0012E09F5C|nr:hypothetical protein [Croceicoccus naphthovorans]MBB3989212.1 hypothetical protein [Croceicoccus naphthovorans]